MEERYQLTLKGLLSVYLDDTEAVHDKILLYLYKNNKNAIVLEDGSLVFGTVEMGKE